MSRSAIFVSQSSRRSIIGGVFATPLLLIGCDWLPASYRFRLSVAVRTPHGIALGSSILESGISRHPQLGGPGVNITLKGEAVSVMLPDGRYLFALVSNDLAYALPYLYLSNVIGDAGEVEAFRTLGGPNRPKRQLDLPTVNYRKLVTFGDISDPASAVPIDPPRLSEWLGVGIQLDRMFVDLTSEPVSRGIRNILPWLPTDPDQPIAQQFKANDAHDSVPLRSHDFSMRM